MLLEYEALWNSQGEVRVLQVWTEQVEASTELGRGLWLESSYVM
jgi:hypothetical protein